MFEAKESCDLIQFLRAVRRTDLRGKNGGRESGRKWWLKFLAVPMLRRGQSLDIEGEVIGLMGGTACRL